MTDEEIAEALADCIRDGEYSYHQKLPPDDGGFSVTRAAFTIKEGVIFLGEEGWYAYPIDIAKFRAAFNVGN